MAFKSEEEINMNIWFLKNIKEIESGQIKNHAGVGMQCGAQDTIGDEHIPFQSWFKSTLLFNHTLTNVPLERMKWWIKWLENHHLWESLNLSSRIPATTWPSPSSFRHSGCPSEVHGGTHITRAASTRLVSAVSTTYLLISEWIS